MANSRTSRRSSSACVEAAGWFLLTHVESALRGVGYVPVRPAVYPSPFTELPPTWDALLSSVSHNLRRKYRYYRRQLEKVGSLSFRSVRGGLGWEEDLRGFSPAGGFWLEGAAWNSHPVPFEHWAVLPAVRAGRRPERLA
jgi:hypothetical protein